MPRGRKKGENVGVQFKLRIPEDTWLELRQIIGARYTKIPYGVVSGWINSLIRQHLPELRTQMIEQARALSQFNLSPVQESEDEPTDQPSE